MIKKFISMVTAAILLGSGLSVIAAAPANATAPVIESTSTITNGQVNPTIVITSASPFRANPDWRSQNFSVSAGTTDLQKSGMTLSGNTITIALTGTALPGTLTVIATPAAFDPNTGVDSNTLSFVVPDAPESTVTISAITFRGQLNVSTSTFDSLPAADRSTIGADFVGGGVQWETPGNITWSPSISNNRFAAGTVYTATFYLTPRYGWSLEGLSSSFFTFVGATSVSITYGGSPREYALISIVFPAATDGSTPAPSTPTLTAAEIAAAAAAVAKAAAEAAAAVRAAEVAVAQTKLSTVLKADKAGTIDEYKSANVNITTAASLARINAEVLKLSANDRSDFAKIKVIADKIEFDESFFNSTARPTLNTYAKYEVVGVTERILPTVNTKVLELPAALRVDAKAIQDLVKVERFVDLVANTETRGGVTSASLIERGLLPADSPYKHSVRSGLGLYPEGSLNTMEKIEAAIKEQIFKAEAPKRLLAEIRARISARKR
jgi:hypothetical protein